jgi:hypothetical protein
LSNPKQTFLQWDPSRVTRDVPQNHDDAAVRGRHRILHVVPGGVMQGAQASFKRLLGAVAPQLWQRLDSGTTGAAKTSDSRRVKRHWNKYCGGQIMVRRTKIVQVALAITVLLATAAILGTAVAQKAAIPKPQDKLALGENEVKQLLLLMDTDQSGKISKQEWMKFMEAEFDRLDKDRKGQLDVKELTQSKLRISRPVNVGK